MIIDVVAVGAVGQGRISLHPFVICIIEAVWTVIYRISQTLACSRSAAGRIRSFSLFHININSGPAGVITYSHATNKLEVFFCQLFDISSRLSQGNAACWLL